MLWEPLGKEWMNRKITLVLECHGDSQWSSPTTSQPFRVQWCADVGSLCAFHDWVVVSVSQAGVVHLKQDEHSKQVSIKSEGEVKMNTFVELCSGLGGTSFGCHFAGLQPKAAVDHTLLATKALQRNQFEGVFHADVRAPSTWMKILEHLEGHQHGMLAGFPCQPFGTLGKHLAFKDQRAWIFFRVLDYSLFAQCAFLMLECVQGAGSNPHIVATLNKYCSIRKFHWKPVVLRLHNSWISRRTRWWAVLLPEHLPLPDFVDLPELPHWQVYSRLFEDWPVWPKHEEEMLLLDEEEQKAFSDDTMGFSNHVLNVNAPCPTLLHSMAHQLRNCSCGCRGPLSPHLLSTQGLHGVLVKSKHDDLSHRHLHPLEAALFVGIPGTFAYAEQVRHDLPLLGQVASPIQSHWLMLQVKQSHGTLGDKSIYVEHENFLGYLLETHKKRWVMPSMFRSRALQLSYPDGTQIQVQIEKPCAAKDLLVAEQKLHGDIGMSLFQDEIEILPDELITSSSLSFGRRTGSGKEFPQEIQGVPGLFHADGLDDLTMLVEGKKLILKAGKDLSSFWSSRHVTLLLEMRASSAILEVKQQLTQDENYGFLWHRAHWLAFCIKKRDGKMQAIFWDGLGSENIDDLPADAKLLAWRFAWAWGFEDFQIEKRQTITQTSGHHCGAIALIHLGQELGLWKQSDEHVAKLWHEVLLMKQRRIGRGPEDDATIEFFSDLLVSKGVPQEIAADRAKLAMKKLGAIPVRQALKAKDPWRALKELGSSQSKPFQLVLYSELQDHIRKKATEKKGAMGSNKGKKQHTKKESTKMQLSPEDLELLPGDFVDADEEVVPFIMKKDIASDARGIAVVSIEFAHELQEHQHNLSIDSLAVVTIGQMAQIKDPDRAEAIQYGALFKSTGEPVLISGTLLQLGDSSVKQKKPDKVPEVSQFDTQVVKIMVFKDAIEEVSWDSFQYGPLKHIIAVTDCLQYCDGQSCNSSCGKFHPAVDEEVHTAVLDAWAWRWSNYDGKIVKMGHADQFSIYIRIPDSALTDLLAVCGWKGIFIEPRASLKLGVNENYKVIWLPKNADIHDALRYKRTMDNVQGVARMKWRYGLRVFTKDEMAALKVIYPDAKVIACDIQCTYEIGPLPFGLSKEKVATLLGDWNWKARPLRPTRSNYAGKFWQIGAAGPPPAPVMPTDQGAVTITLQSETQEAGSSKQWIQASSKTQAVLKKGHVTKETHRDEDIWEKGQDPWSKWRNYQASSSAQGSDATATAPAAAKDTNESRKRVKQLTEEVEGLKNELTQRKNGSDKMEVDQSSITSDVKELQAQGSKFEGWFHEAGTRMTQMEEHIRAQGHQITGLQAAVQHQAEATTQIQQQVTDVKISVEEKLRESIENQTNRIEALFEKRFKTC